MKEFALFNFNYQKDADLKEYNSSPKGANATVSFIIHDDELGMIRLMSRITFVEDDYDVETYIEFYTIDINSGDMLWRSEKEKLVNIISRCNLFIRMYEAGTNYYDINTIGRPDTSPFADSVIVLKDKEDGVFIDRIDYDVMDTLLNKIAAIGNAYGYKLEIWDNESTYDSIIYAGKNGRLYNSIDVVLDRDKKKYTAERLTFEYNKNLMSFVAMTN